VKRTTQLIVSIILGCLIIIVPIIGITLVSVDEFNEEESEFRINLYDLQSSQNYITLLEDSDLRFELNEENADSAPKQTVVALWNIMDKQSIIIMENNDLVNQNYELAKHNDYLIMQNEILINSKNKNQLILISILISASFIGLSMVMMPWIKKGNNNQ